METTKVNLENHLILEQSMIRLPYETLRMNFKMSQKYVEKHSSFLLSEIEKLNFNTENEIQASMEQLNNILYKTQELKEKVVFFCKKKDYF